jgi:hypothetical protein
MRAMYRPQLALCDAPQVARQHRGTCLDTCWENRYILTELAEFIYLKWFNAASEMSRWRRAERSLHPDLSE